MAPHREELCPSRCLHEPERGTAGGGEVRLGEAMHVSGVPQGGNLGLYLCVSRF